MPVVFGIVNQVAAGFVDVHFFRVHTVLAKVFDLNGFKVADAGVKCQFGPLYILDFEAFHQLAADVQTCGRCSNSALHLCIDCLIALFVVGVDVTQGADFFGKWSLSHTFDQADELVVRAVVEESDGTTARGGIVDHFGHESVAVAKVEFVADADFASGVDDDVPKACFGV